MRRSHIATIGLWALAACSPAGGPDSPGHAGPLRVGVLPDQSEEQLRLLYEPLLAYLEAATDLDLELIVPDGYRELLDEFAAGRVQLAWFGGVTFVQAVQRSGAEPLVLRDVDLEFTSDFLVARHAGAESLEELAGCRFAFGPRLSTSGHLMPRYFLGERGIEPEEHFGEVRHSAGHDQTARWVQDGAVHLAVVNSQVVESMLREGRLSPERVRVLERTPPFRNYVWAVQADLAPRLRGRLLNAFLALASDVPEQAAILESLGAQGFLPASRQDYVELEAAATQLGLAWGAPER